MAVEKTGTHCTMMIRDNMDYPCAKIGKGGFMEKPIPSVDVKFDKGGNHTGPWLRMSVCDEVHTVVSSTLKFRVS